VDEIANELSTNSLHVEETQSFINGDWVRPGLYDILDQVTLRLPLHTFRGPGATPHEQVLLSDRQTLLTTSLEVVQVIIYDRVLEAEI